MDKYILRSGAHPNGIMTSQTIYRFPNNYGASVVTGGFAYGGLELAVLKFHGEGDDDSEICYDTTITDDVIGYLTETELEDLLIRIKDLKK